jgi:DNA-directed RNA polymerase alpha subunit
MKVTIELESWEELHRYNQLFSLKATESSPFLKEPISELGLTVRSYNCLRNEEIETIGQLCDLSETNLMRIINLGRKSVFEIRKALLDKNLSLSNKFNVQFEEKRISR